MKIFHVYMVTNKPDGTLYIGVTSHLIQRVYQHRSGTVPGFTKKYNLRKLVWFEEHSYAEDALLRERRLKKWNRAWKVDLIEAANPDWRDLWEEVCV